jgi:hypothetical protein
LFSPGFQHRTPLKVSCLHQCKLSKALSNWAQNLQRGDTGQKPKHAPFCMKNATTHKSLH